MTIKPDFIRSLSDSKKIITSASGLVKIDDTFYCVADDELSLVSFSGERESSLTLRPLFAGQLPQDPKERKKLKPDLEALVQLDYQLLLAVPSGSKKNRTRGALVDLGGAAHEVDFSGLYNELEKEIHDLNIEGAVATETEIRLFQRGNGKARENAVIVLDRAKVQTDPGRSLKTILRSDLGVLNGVPLSFTDATLIKNRLFFLAVAENTESTYDDGDFKGAVLGWLDEKGQVLFSEELLIPEKPEGLCFDAVTSEFFVVTDADNPQKSSALYSFPLKSVRAL